MKNFLRAVFCSWLIVLPVLSSAEEIPTFESLQAQYPDSVVTVEYFLDLVMPDSDFVTVLYPNEKILGCIIIVVVVAIVVWGVIIYITYRICKKPSPPVPPQPPVTNSAPNTPFPA